MTLFELRVGNVQLVNENLTDDSTELKRLEFENYNY